MTTYHSVLRAQERLGLNEQSAEKKIKKAYERGKTAEQFTGRERAYLLNRNSDGITSRVYQNSCYIFNPFGFCITVYPLPNWFGKKTRYAGNNRIRNYKKYYTFNCLEIA